MLNADQIQDYVTHAENIRETSVDEVIGEYTVTHHTKTWDTKLHVAQIAVELDEAKQNAAKAQELVEELQHKLDAASPAEVTPS